MDMGVLTVHLSDVEHGGDIGDVEHGSDMSPLSGSHDITHDDVNAFATALKVCGNFVNEAINVIN